MSQRRTWRAISVSRSDDLRGTGTLLGYDWRVNVEFKEIKGVSALKAQKLSTGLVDKMIALIRELEMENQVTIPSFDHSMVYILKQGTSEIVDAVLVATSSKRFTALPAADSTEAYNLHLAPSKPMSEVAPGRLRSQHPDCQRSTDDATIHLPRSQWDPHRLSVAPKGGFRGKRVS